LYRRYLEQFDYKGLFKGYTSENRRWPMPTAMWVRPIEKVLRELLGPEYQHRFAKYASYFGHYSNQYALYGFRHFLKSVPSAVIPPQAQGVIALGIETWLRENGIGEVLQLSA